MAVVPHKFLDLKLFRSEGFLFHEWLTDRGLAKFVQMTSDCYPDLVQVFYANLKVVDGVICSRVKDVDIKIDDEIWLCFTGLKEEGFMSHERNSQVNKWTHKKKIYMDCLRYPKRLKIYKPYLHGGMKREEKMCAFVISLVAAMSDHMIEIASHHGHNLPYGVFINSVLKHNQVDLTGEKNFRCTKSNGIGKAALTFINLKKTEDGWVFKDVRTPILDVDETPSTFTPHTEFERFVVDQFQRLSTRISKVEKTMIMIHKKVDEDNALRTPSVSEFDYEDDTT
ncbi:hypothetical protein LR48_Vigan10g123600 [Vigna angularis]|uniref:Uncharacterized protein n=1 Tax=Phaseolus angularis TaxID=3914 RepID=A0A0L9VKT5_PHAAN|nr:uncharacterized protein HKW66_Vig0117430 [Vigna angularis]KOM55344.1 hypothetical protein LR48_Vigan10g123600 [Vigna angularis]